MQGYALMCISFSVLLLTPNTILATTRAAGTRRNTHFATRTTLLHPGIRTARTGTPPDRAQNSFQNP
mgnify:CR=1 FL=1